MVIPKGWQPSESNPQMLKCERCNALACGVYVRDHQCDADKLPIVSDDALRSECLRRWPKSVEFSQAALTDDQLRAECNRRWGEDDCPMAKTLRHERDDWKRRAEAAEKREPLNILLRQRLTGMRRLTSVSGGGVSHGVELTAPIIGPVDVLVVRPLTAEGGVSRLVESGPGIDPRPDNSIAHLDEDLLCEDAP